MAPPSPAVLPISKPQTTTSTGSGGVALAQPPIPTPNLRSFIYNISETVREGLAHRRPWYELVDRSAFSKPESISEATFRIRKNVSYFRVNYLSGLALVLAISLFTNPFALFLLLGLLAAWLFLYLFRPSDTPLVVFGRPYSDKETLGILILSTIVVIFLTSVGSVLMSSIMAGSAMIAAHGALRVPEDLFIDNQEPAANGFLSFIASSAASAAAPAVAARV